MKTVGLLIVLGIIAVIAGVLLASQASSGAALVGAGCFLGILARIIQANRLHDMTMEGFTEVVKRLK